MYTHEKYMRTVKTYIKLSKLFSLAIEKPRTLICNYLEKPMCIHLSMHTLTRNHILTCTITISI